MSFLITDLTAYLCRMNTTDTPGYFEVGQMLLINKPIEWTSFDVVRKLRNAMKIKKVGHAGTLDPLATGLLIVCTGKFTKKINDYMAKEKEYTGTITLGATTPTYDLESEPMDPKPIDHIDLSALQKATNSFMGLIEQIPPAHSAIKVDGKRVYELARKGVEVELKPRQITIHAFEIVSYEAPLVKFRVVCSTGTYIRSLAHDFGKVLGCGAYLSELCRTRIGEFELKNAMDMDQALEHIREHKDQKG